MATPAPAPSGNALRVLIADDHELFRAGVRGLIRGFRGIEVVAEAANGHEAVELTRRHEPDVVLIDVAMPRLNGIDAAQRITAASPRTRVIILSMHTGEEHVTRALKAGATGYLLKDAQPAELERAIRQVSRGEPYLSSAVSKVLVQGYARGTDTPLQRLTSRQREVLQLMAEGHTTKAIASRLRVSVKTVETHRAQLMERLGIRDVPGLVRFALRHGLVAEDA
jgi:DNA-binding NarL/FixJ family response regulator